MGASGLAESAQHELQKRPYRNQTAGWVGYIRLDHLGAPIGDTVEPHGTVWLSDIEARLTARAPAQARDNPFVEQDFEFEDAEGSRVTQQMAPLKLITEERDIPAHVERFVPSVADDTKSAGVLDREHMLAADAEDPRPTSDKPGWVENVQPAQQVQKGALGGSNAAKPGPAEDEIEGKIGSNLKQAAAAPSGQVAEETAATLPSGEETGAAETPTNDAPEGEYASTEEVGSPDAPTKVKGK